MPTDLKGWHRGERAIQRKLGFGDEVRMSYAMVGSYMSEQHRVFHTSNIPFIPVTILDESGRPWGSVFAGKGGEIGFVKSPDECSMSMDLVSWEGDPLLENLGGRKDEKGRVLVAGIGIELSTRRRNKFAGWIESSSTKHDATDVHLKLHVNQALGYVRIPWFQFWLGLTWAF
jgi:hypothetical protein